MYTNVNLAAPIGVLLFLGTGFVLFVASLVLLHALIVRRTARAGVVLLLGLLFVVVYAGIMLIFSFTSSEKVLARGQEKHFCEIDCHLAYSIVDVQTTKSLGNGPNQKNAAGDFYVVTIKTRFDPNTISATRGDGQLTPNPRVVTLRDGAGRVFSPLPEAERSLAGSSGVGMPFTTPLRPGESYTTTVVFDVPTDMQNPTLQINESDWITHFIIGHENSLLHKQTKFQLGV